MLEINLEKATTKYENQNAAEYYQYLSEGRSMESKGKKTTGKSVDKRVTHPPKHRHL